PHALHFLNEREVRVVDAVINSGRRLTQSLQRCFSASSIASDDEHARAHGGQFLRSYRTNARCGSGNNHNLVLHMIILLILTRSVLQPSPARCVESTGRGRWLDLRADPFGRCCRPERWHEGTPTTV